MKLARGVERALHDLDVRATEFTRRRRRRRRHAGEAARQRAAYTYAAEFSVDEALAAGATEVGFTKPVVDLPRELPRPSPVGTPVPVGYYDRERGDWVGAHRTAGLSDRRSPVAWRPWTPTATGPPTRGSASTRRAQPSSRSSTAGSGALARRGRATSRRGTTTAPGPRPDDPAGPRRPSSRPSPTTPVSGQGGRSSGARASRSASACRHGDSLRPRLPEPAGRRAARTTRARSTSRPCRFVVIPLSLHDMRAFVHVAGRTTILEGAASRRTRRHTYAWNGLDAYGRARPRRRRGVGRARAIRPRAATACRSPAGGSSWAAFPAPGSIGRRPARGRGRRAVPPAGHDRDAHLRPARHRGRPGPRRLDAGRPPCL